MPFTWRRKKCGLGPTRDRKVAGSRGKQEASQRQELEAEAMPRDRAAGMGRGAGGTASEEDVGLGLGLAARVHLGVPLPPRGCSARCIDWACGKERALHGAGPPSHRHRSGWALPMPRETTGPGAGSLAGKTGRKCRERQGLAADTGSVLTGGD